MAITFSGVATQIDHSWWSKKPQETTSDGLLHFKWDIDMSPILTYHIHGFRCKQFDSKYLKGNICWNYLFHLFLRFYHSGIVQTLLKTLWCLNCPILKWGLNSSCTNHSSSFLYLLCNVNIGIVLLCNNVAMGPKTKDIVHCTISLYEKEFLVGSFLNSSEHKTVTIGQQTLKMCQL